MSSATLRARLLFRAAAWPLLADGAFRRALVHLPEVSAQPKATACGRRAIVREIARDLRAEAHHTSLEALEAIVSHALGERHEQTCLSDHLSRFRSKLIDHPVGDSEGALVRRREATLLLPQDLLGPRPSPPALFSRAVPIAEGHVHLSGALAFSQVWAHLLADLPHSSNGSSLAPFGTLNALLRRCAAAAVGRVALRAWLENPDAGRFVQHREHVINRLVDRVSSGWHATHVADVLRRALEALALGSDLLEDDGEELRLVRQAQGLDQTFPEPVFALSAEADAKWTDAFLARLSSEHDPDARALFWQIQRVRCRLYGWLTQRPSTAGLSWFCEHFERIDQLKLASDVVGAWERSLVRGRIDAFEIRRTPTGHDSLEKVWQLARDLAKARLDHRVSYRRRSAIVLHFAKSGAVEDPRANEHGCRFGDWFATRSLEAAEVAYQIRRHPDLLMFVRGLDVCNRELDVPTWAVLPLFRVPRDASREVARDYSLRLTAHAGEEFRSLHEGLRRVHELLAFDGLRNRDRIGHALSVSLDVRRWAEAEEGCRQPREERLWDLVWEYGVRIDPQEPWGKWPFSARLATLRRDIGRLANALGWATWLPRGTRLAEALVDVRRHLLDGSALTRLNFPNLPTRCPKDAALSRVWHYLTSRPSLVSEEVPTTAAEVEFLERMQRRIQEEIRRCDITVEVNPSSNLVVGSLETADRHPAIALDHAGIRLSLNSDDPLTFATTLADEYELFGTTLRRMGLSKTETKARLEALAERGFEATFALEETNDPARLRRFIERYG